MDIEAVTQGFRRLAEISQEIRTTQEQLSTLRDQRADCILYLRNDCDQTWVSIADTAEVDYKRVIDIAKKRELYLLRNPVPITELSEQDLEDMRRRLEELNGAD